MQATRLQEFSDSLVMLKPSTNGLSAGAHLRNPDLSTIVLRLKHLCQKPSGLGNSATPRMAAGCCPAPSPLTYHTLSAQAQSLYFYLFSWYLHPANLKETEESSPGLFAP